MVDFLTAAIGLPYEKRQRTSWLVDFRLCAIGMATGMPGNSEEATESLGPMESA